MTTTVLTNSTPRLTKGKYLPNRYYKLAFEGEKVWPRSKIVDIIKRDNARAPECTYARHSEPHAFYLRAGSTGKLLTMERMTDEEDSIAPAQRRGEGTRVTFGFKATLWFEEHEYYQYARQQTSYYCKKQDWKVPPTTSTFTEVADFEFFDVMDHDKTGATYLPGTKEVVLWTDSNKLGTMSYIGHVPDTVFTHYFGESIVEKHMLYCKGYNFSQEFNCSIQEYLYYVTTIHNSYYRPTLAGYPLTGDPTITAYTVNEGILKEVEDMVPEVIWVPAPVRPPPEIIDLVMDDGNEATAVEVQGIIPVFGLVSTDTDEVQVMEI